MPVVMRKENALRALNIVFGWCIAVVVAASLGSMIQTQFNLLALESLGTSISWGERLGATVHDLRSFSPTYALLTGLAFALAWPVAGLLCRRWPARRPMCFALAGFVAIATLLTVMNLALPVTLIGATRNPVATFLLAAAGVLAGWLYVWLIPPDSLSRRTRSRATSPRRTPR